MNHLLIPDQEIDLPEFSKYHAAAAKVYVGKRKISFSTKESLYKQKFSFSKRLVQGTKTFTIDVEKREIQAEMKTCELGHTHIIKEGKPYDFASIEITPELFEQLLDWFQTQ